MFGVHVATDWQKPPMVSLAGYDGAAFQPDAVSESMENLPSFPGLPWSDVTIFSPISPNPPCDGGQLLVRIMPMADAARKVWAFPMVQDPVAPPLVGDHWRCVSLLLQNGKIFVSSFFVDPDSPWDIPPHILEELGPGEREDCTLWADYRMVVTLFAHLLQCPEHSVSCTTINPTTTGSSRTGRRKPWLRNDLTRIILLDPKAAATNHGMRANPREDRKSPLPHQRRGHWRRLDERRRTWVRQSWIGPVSWEYQGQTYRVMTADA